MLVTDGLTQELWLRVSVRLYPKAGKAVCSPILLPVFKNSLTLVSRRNGLAGLSKMSC